jgi:uncharacterized membrane protein YgdD (TMEM256/DUF423 family)
VNPAGRRALCVGAILGLLGVAAGAFGAHGLRDSVSARDLEIWQTAAHYQQVHAVLLVAVGLLGGRSWSRPLAVCAVLLVAGIVVFAGTLQAMVLGGPRFLGAITPIGGLCLMGGWLCLVAHGLRGAAEKNGG